MAADGDQAYQPTSRGPLFDSYDWLGTEIADEIPGLDVVQEAISDALKLLAHAAHSNAVQEDPVQESRSRIVNQANNDFLDLLYESMSGRGRPAVRSARSLFEHAVNQRWITLNAAEAERYRDHRAIGDLLDLDLNTSREEDFSGSTRKQVRHWRAKLERRIRPAADAVLERYGPSFRRSWSTKSLRTRAEAVDLGDEYDMYRLLSAVIHGAAGGDIGHRVEIAGVDVLRTGPAISACPLAFKVGLRYYRTMLSDLQSVFGAAATSALESLLDDLDRIVPDHAQLCADVDARLWPAEAPVAVMYLRVEIDASRVWLLLDGSEPRTVVADLVNPDPAQLQRISDTVAGVELANPGRTQPIIIGAPGIKGIPRPGHLWRPAEETLRRADHDDDGGPTLRPVKVKEPIYDPSLHL